MNKPRKVELNVQVAGWITGQSYPKLWLRHLFANHFEVVQSLDACYVAGQQVVAEVDIFSGRLTIVEYLL